jgi:pimeloyl-ACP methyl ester carboxylesterase
MTNPSSAPRVEHIALPDGARIEAHSEGVGMPLLLISGLGGTAGFWQPCLPALTPHHQVLRLDQRGIAKSSRGSAACTIDQLADDCLAVLDHFEIDSALIVGHSTGGCITQSIALRHPARVRACVMSGAWGAPSRHRQELFSVRREMLVHSPVAYASSSVFMGYDTAWLNAHWTVLESAVRNAPLTPAAQRIVMERIDALVAYDQSAALSAINVPRLVIGARDDLIVPAFLQEQLHALLPGSDLKIFDYGGHFFPVSRTELFTSTLLQWFAKTT